MTPYQAGLTKQALLPMLLQERSNPGSITGPEFTSGLVGSAIGAYTVPNLARPWLDRIGGKYGRAAAGLATLVGSMSLGDIIARKITGAKDPTAYRNHPIFNR